jgi:hypothetical protein
MKHEEHREGVIYDLRGGFRTIDRQLEITLADGKGTIAVIVHDRLVKGPGVASPVIALKKLWPSSAVLLSRLMFNISARLG